MTDKRLILAAGLLAFGTTSLHAQESKEESEVREEAAMEQAEIEGEMARAAADIERAAREIEQAARETEGRRVDVEIEMRKAESRMAEAARRMAELSMQRLPRNAGNWTAELEGRPVLGITIGSRDKNGPVEGVEVVGITPGGAAEEAGLRAGDVISAINGESLAADDVKSANERLVDFMSAVDEGDSLDVDYLRDGRSGKVTVEPRVMEHQVFSFRGTPGVRLAVPPDAPLPPDVPQVVGNRFVFISDAGGLGDMEMVTLTEGLGRYFGTDEGLLVVRAPEDTDTYKLEDGDVILDIDGREPNSVSHAVRILGSYQSGETLKIRIMRDKRAQTIEIEMPDTRTGWRMNDPAIVTDPEPTASVAPVVDNR